MTSWFPMVKLTLFGLVTLLALVLTGCFAGGPDSGMERNLKECGPISSEDAKTLAWLSRIRLENKLPMGDPALRPCNSGTRKAVGSEVKSGGWERVYEFFTAKNCMLESAPVCRASDGADRYKVWVVRDSSTVGVLLATLISKE